MYEIVIAWNGVPGWAEAPARAEPQALYVELAQQGPVAPNERDPRAAHRFPLGWD